MADGAAASGLRDDRNVCQLCGALENLSLCGGCRVTWYCCKDHQRAHWKQHKGKCKRRNQANHKGSVGQEIESSSSKDIASSGNPAGPQLLETVSNQTSVTSTVAVSGKQNLENSRETSVTDTACVFTASATGTNSINSTPAPTEVCQTSSKSTESEVDQTSSRETDTSQGPGKSKVPKGKRASGGGASNAKKDNNIQLSAIPEESSPDERFFLDTFSQTIQSSVHVDRVRQSARTMVPQGGSVNSNAYVDILKSRFSVIAEYVVTCLNKYNICVIDGFLGEVTGQEILNEVKQLHSLGVMQKGQLVHASSASDTIRGDIITWIDARGTICENIQYLVSCMDAVVKNCSALLEGYTINERTKAMVACYPGKSSGYVRHVDNPNEDGRCLTCIYYLNQDWDVRTEGGMLRIYPEGTDTVANIEPNFDRLLFFWSDRRNPHEVLPAMRERYAITVWYYEAEERARALKKFKGEVSTHPKKQAVPLFSTSPDSTH